MSYNDLIELHFELINNCSVMENKMFRLKCYQYNNLYKKLEHISFVIQKVCLVIQT